MFLVASVRLCIMTLLEYTRLVAELANSAYYPAVKGGSGKAIATSDLQWLDPTRDPSIDFRTLDFTSLAQRLFVRYGSGGSAETWWDEHQRLPLAGALEVLAQTCEAEKLIKPAEASSATSS